MDIVGKLSASKDRMKILDLQPRRVSGTFVASVLASIATAALTSLIFLSFSPPQQPPSSSTGGMQGTTQIPLTDHEAAVETVVSKVSPAVVSIVATKDLPVIEQFFVNPFGNDQFFNEFFPFQFRIPQYRQKGTEKQEVSAGTGFIVSEDGTILTNRHVVDIEDADFTVIFSDGSREKAEVLAKDPVEDIAVLRVGRRGLPTVTLGDSDGIKVGQTAIAIGNSLGKFQNTVSVGVISGLARQIAAGDQRGASEVIEGAIQTDAAINPGNSGGPLLNLKGEAIGINTAIVVGSQNVGFAIPINKAKKALDDVRGLGKITYPFLGVRYVLVTQEIKEARGLSVDHGALIIGSSDGREPGVQPNSPAQKAGLREGDVILSVNGERVDENHSLAALIQKHRVGETVTLRVLSGSDERDVSVTLAERK